MKTRYKFPIAIILITTGIFLFTIKVDRVDTNLRADEGQTNGVILTSTSAIQQTFTTNRSSISNIGFYLRPTAKQIPAGDITMIIYQNSQSLDSATVSTAFIDVEGLTRFNFANPVNIDPGQPVTASLQVTSVIDGAIRLQLRELSQDQDPTTVSLTINSTTSARPAGFQTYSPIHPPLALQIGGLFILVSILLFIPSLAIYSLGAALIFTIPVAGSTDLKLLIFATTAIALSGMILLLRSFNIPRLPALFGAHIFAFNTWFLLQLADGRQIYSLLALLPLIYILVVFRARTVLPLPDRLLKNPSPLKGRGLGEGYSWLYRLSSLHSPNHRNLIIPIIIFTAVLLLLAAPSSLLVPLNDHANPRDIFLDPIQSLNSAKIIGAGWSNFGAYVGLINLTLAIIGIIWRIKKYWPLAALGLIAYFLTQLAPVTFFTPQHLTIFTVFSLAFFAAWGLLWFRQFFSLDTSGQFRKFITVIISLIALIALLDLWQVSATVWT